MGELQDMWKRMSAGDPLAFLGQPAPTQPSPARPVQPRPVPANTGDGTPPNSLTQHEREILEKFYHQQYGHYPESEYQFQTWLKHNW